MIAYHYFSDRQEAIKFSYTVKVIHIRPCPAKYMDRQMEMYEVMYIDTPADKPAELDRNGREL